MQDVTGLLRHEDYTAAMALTARLRIAVGYVLRKKVTVNAPEPDLRLNRCVFSIRFGLSCIRSTDFFPYRRLDEVRMTKWVYRFGAGHNEGRADMRNLLGGKGANLAEMASIGPAGPARLHNHRRCVHRLLRQ